MGVEGGSSEGMGAQPPHLPLPGPAIPQPRITLPTPPCRQVSLSSDKRQLGELEDRILQLLSASDPATSLLDDEQLLAALNDAKQTSGGAGPHA